MFWGIAQRIFREEVITMSEGAKIPGHSVHPILIIFPLGLLSTSVVFDIVYLVSERDTFELVAFWMVVSGVITGAAAAFFGWIDWFAIPATIRAKSVGLIHGGLVASVLLIFATRLYFRYSAVSQTSTLAIGFSIVGAALALIGGWFGGELVERLGLSVHPGAHLDAPNSLTGPVNGRKPVGK